jgi:hypothetical protein
MNRCKHKIPGAWCSQCSNGRQTKKKFVKNWHEGQEHQQLSHRLSHLPPGRAPTIAGFLVTPSGEVHKNALEYVRAVSHTICPSCNSYRLRFNPSQRDKDPTKPAVGFIGCEGYRAIHCTYTENLWGTKARPSRIRDAGKKQGRPAAPPKEPVKQPPFHQSQTSEQGAPSRPAKGSRANKAAQPETISTPTTVSRPNAANVTVPIPPEPSTYTPTPSASAFGCQSEFFVACLFLLIFFSYLMYEWSREYSGDRRG